ncbi:hypothetical protein AHF37_05387 [Paragonimus kellicotti]|nr:hypothetical protein AHF37_05387 [Paragonimus kellicotti]
MSEESVKVAVRLRPFNQREKENNAELIVSMKGNSTIIMNPDNRSEERQFTFDYSYWSHDGYRADSDGVLLPDGPTSRYASQQMVFDDLGKGVLDNAFKGYACSLLGHGQTGSGKSYSIMGYGPNRGIVPIICAELFRRIGQTRDKVKKFQVTFSMMEIYNEQIRDLLSKGQSDGKYLQLRQSPDNGFYVQSLTQVPVGSFKEIEQRMDQVHVIGFLYPKINTADF